MLGAGSTWISQAIPWFPLAASRISVWHFFLYKDLKTIWHNNSFPFLIAKWSHPSPVDFLLMFSEPVGTPACSAVHAASSALVTGCKAVWYGVAWLAGEAEWHWAVARSIASAIVTCYAEDFRLVERSCEGNWMTYIWISMEVFIAPSGFEFSLSSFFYFLWHAFRVELKVFCVCSASFCGICWLL